jgi:hypothetical protein
MMEAHPTVVQDAAPDQEQAEPTENSVDDVNRSP